MITWHAQLFANGVEWKIESEVYRTQPDIKFKKRWSVRVTTFLRQAFKCFWSSSWSRSVTVVHVWANVLLCGAERKKGSRIAFFMLNWIPRRRFKTLKASRVQVYEIQPHWDKHSVQVLKLSAYREGQELCTFVQMFCWAVPSDGNEHYGRRSYGFHGWTFVTGVLVNA